jgi:type III restriction enzyme
MGHIGMALHPDFPRSPYEILPPDLRWFPAAEEMRAAAYEKLLPPLVANIRREVNDWRNSGYAGASPTSRALLEWWFGADHLVEQSDAITARLRHDTCANGLHLVLSSAV